MKELCACSNRRVYVVNLDPAAGDLQYECDIGVVQQPTLIFRHSRLDFHRWCCWGDEIRSQWRPCVLYRVSVWKFGMAWRWAFTIWWGRLFYIWLSRYTSMVIFWWLGQIELFTHFSYIGDIAKRLTDFGFRLMSLYLVSCWMLCWFVDGLPFYLWWGKVYLWKSNGTLVHASIRFTSSQRVNKMWLGYCRYSWKVCDGNLVDITCFWDCWFGLFHIDSGFQMEMPCCIV